MLNGAIPDWVILTAAGIISFYLTIKIMMFIERRKEKRRLKKNEISTQEEREGLG
jgi:hypothetical protein